MAKQQKVQKRALSSSNATSSSAEFLQTRPFAASNNSTASPNIQKQSQKTSKIGHSFGQIPIQPKLKIGEPGDKYEQEADNVAAQVVQKINEPSTQRQELGEEEDLQMKPESGTIQRDELPDEDELQMKPESGTIQRDELPEEDELQMKSETGTIQREELPEEEELQMKPQTIQRQSKVDAGTATDEFETSLNNARSGGQSLQPELRMKMESAMGADFSGVKVHTDAKSDKLNKSIQAKAFTTGRDVFFRQGEYNPGSQGGQELIAHELTHVVQQGGNVSVQKSTYQDEKSRHISPTKVTLGKSTIQRDTIFGRKRRIIGRWLNRKTLPINTYRWDTRKPGEIANSGFQPWNKKGNILLDEHVNNIFASGSKQGKLAKYESQWVSTGAYGMLKKLDPTFAQQVLNTNLYKIDTSLASKTGKFSDVNDHFDKINKDRPYASQREWAKLGGIPPKAVVSWMDGKTFINQYDLKNGAPDESKLTGWKPMPKKN